MLRDKDFLELETGFYQVVGYVHPPNSAIAIPRYIKVDFATPWRNDFFYQRVLEDYSSSSISSSLKKFSSKYLTYDPSFDSIIPIIPLKEVKKIYYASEWEKYKKRSNSLYERAEELIDRIIEETNVKREELGVTGSLLIGIHGIYSDIDLVVYGMKATEKIKEFMLNSEMLDKSFERIRGLDDRSYEILIFRRWNKGKYKGRRFSINPVMKEDEIKFRYGDFKIKNIVVKKLEFKIKERKDPYFFPIVYSTDLKEITEFAIYESYYMDLFKENDRVEVLGMIQRVETKNEEYLRIAYGLREVEEQYIKLI